MPNKPQRMTAELPLGTDPQSVRHRVEALEHLLEGLFEVPGLGRKVGLDAIVGLIPVASPPGPRAAPRDRIRTLRGT